MKTLLTNCSVIDCTGAATKKDVTVVVDGNQIEELRPGSVEVPESGASAVPYAPVGTHDDTRVIDLQGGYLLPGFWEVHTHLGDLIPDPHNYLETESLNDYVIRAGRNAMDALRSGITGIRCVGDDGFSDVAWKRAFNKGVMMGPRLFVCTKGISITGGHGHGTLGALEVDGPMEMRKAVRDNIKHGADQIKLMVTGGIMTEGEGMDESQFLLDEIQAASEVARQKGIKLVVHTWGAKGVKTALRGGANSIEHGLLDAEAIEMLLDKEAFYVPTICATQDVDFINELPEYQIEKALGAATAHREGLLMAVEAGVKIALGSDSTPTNEFNKREFEFMVKVGISPMDTLIAGTRTSADLCGVAHDLGTVESGKLADLVVLGSDPLADISAVRDVRLVMKDGHLVNLQPQEGVVDYFELYC
ncbi:metal-dependent hydrolase family protein [Elongatibacter sediminis]|uniref:Amidohydrolase family protein n=1 Tax=Elongatibacter sediminis TaxID=3119006 RepID=A0AAW9R6P0_9GAMM